MSAPAHTEASLAGIGDELAGIGDMRMPKRSGDGIALLADPTRRRIVAALAIRRRRPAELAAEIALSRPATTRQLKILRHAGLIDARRSLIDGRGVLYGIDPRRHGQITAWLLGTELVRPPAEPALDDHPQRAGEDVSNTAGRSA